MSQWLLIILPVVAIVSWWLGRKSHLSQSNDSTPHAKEYIQGINYLLNEQADKAVELFIHLIEVDDDTLETHIALGNLFRQRGEVDRAIRIHQNIIARPQISKSHRIKALLALGRDYMLAGVFDRAEKLMSEVIDSGEYVTDSLLYLLDIYQQEKDWEQAIIVSHRLANHTGKTMQTEIAHYYCELALEAKKDIGVDQASRYLKRAFSVDYKCVRASLLLGQWEIEAGHHLNAMRVLQRVYKQDPDFFSEAIPGLLECAVSIQKEHAMIQFLLECVDAQTHPSIVAVIAKYLQQSKDSQTALQFVEQQLDQNPSLSGILEYLNLQAGITTGHGLQIIQTLMRIIVQMLSARPLYQCIKCGFSGKVLHWQCPSCKLWGSIKPLIGTESDQFT